jgi:hypothetical protein
VNSTCSHFGAAAAASLSRLSLLTVPTCISRKGKQTNNERPKAPPKKLPIADQRSFTSSSRLTETYYTAKLPFAELRATLKWVVRPFPVVDGAIAGVFASILSIGAGKDKLFFSGRNKTLLVRQRLMLAHAGAVRTQGMLRPALAASAAR